MNKILKGLTRIKEWFVISVYGIGIIAILGGTAGAFVTFYNNNSPDNGIYTIGDGNAVYLAGELCTINAQLDRPVQNMRNDFEKCMEWHMMYVDKLNK